jgi:hypothetical protein
VEQCRRPPPRAACPRARASAKFFGMPPRSPPHRPRGAWTTDTPAFPAQWFTTYFVLSSVNQRLPPSPVQSFSASLELSACLGAPGPHDFAVRKVRRSSVGTFTSTAFRTTFVTIAIRPSCRCGTMRPYNRRQLLKSRIFFAWTLDSFFRTAPDGQISLRSWSYG